MEDKDQDTNSRFVHLITVQDLIKYNIIYIQIYISFVYIIFTWKKKRETNEMTLRST